MQQSSTFQPTDQGLECERGREWRVQFTPFKANWHAPVFVPIPPPHFRPPPVLHRWRPGLATNVSGPHRSCTGGGQVWQPTFPAPTGPAPVEARFGNHAPGPAAAFPAPTGPAPVEARFGNQRFRPPPVLHRWRPGLATTPGPAAAFPAPTGAGSLLGQREEGLGWRTRLFQTGLPPVQDRWGATVIRLPILGAVAFQPVGRLPWWSNGLPTAPSGDRP